MANSLTTRLFSLSVDRSLPMGGDGARRQVAPRKEERSAALNYSVFKVQTKRHSASSQYNGHFSSAFGGYSKKYFCFFLHFSFSFENSRDINTTSSAVNGHTHATEQAVDINFKLAFTQKQAELLLHDESENSFFKIIWVFQPCRAHVFVSVIAYII